MGPFGRHPTKIMERVSGVRRADAHIRLSSAETSQNGNDQFVPALLAAR
jgi:hypothetical protein